MWCCCHKKKIKTDDWIFCDQQELYPPNRITKIQLFKNIKKKEQRTFITHLQLQKNKISFEWSCCRYKGQDVDHECILQLPIPGLLLMRGLQKEPLKEIELD